MSVSTLTQPKLMTAEELWRLPDNGMRQDLVKGVIREMPPAGFEHGDIALNVSAALKAFARRTGHGRAVSESGFVISHNPDTVRAPDGAFVARDRVTEPPPQKYFDGAPDLALEVVSPSDTATEVHEKVDEWLQAGARLVWVVYPRRRTVVVYRSPREAVILREGDTLSGEDVMPGFELPVAEVFV